MQHTSLKVLCKNQSAGSSIIQFVATCMHAAWRLGPACSLEPGSWNRPMWAVHCVCLSVV